MINPALATKICRKCHEEKIASLEFPPNKVVCKKCSNAYSKAYRNAKPGNGWGNFLFGAAQYQRKDIRDTILDV